MVTGIVAYFPKTDSESLQASCLQNRLCKLFQFLTVPISMVSDQRWWNKMCLGESRSFLGWKRRQLAPCIILSMVSESWQKKTISFGPSSNARALSSGQKLSWKPREWLTLAWLPSLNNLLFQWWLHCSYIYSPACFLSELPSCFYWTIV